MNKEELKLKMKTLSEQMDKESDKSKIEEMKKSLQRLVETYVQMTTPTNRMMEGAKVNE